MAKKDNIKFKKKSTKQVSESMLCKGIWTEICSNYKYNDLFYELEYNGKKYLVRRDGNCEPDVCGSACCKFKSDYGLTENQIKYHLGFGEKTKFEGCVNYNIICKHLSNKLNKCKLWDSDEFPEACRQFPHPIDSTYWNIHNKCKFKFVIMYELIEY